MGGMASAAVAGLAGLDDRFELEYRLGADGWRREALGVCAGERFEIVEPVRSFHFEKGLESFAGWWWAASSGRHVGFESWLERDLDRTTRRVMVATVSHG